MVGVLPLSKSLQALPLKSVPPTWWMAYVGGSGLTDREVPRNCEL